MFYSTRHLNNTERRLRVIKAQDRIYDLEIELVNLQRDCPHDWHRFLKIVTCSICRDQRPYIESLHKLGSTKPQNQDQVNKMIVEIFHGGSEIPNPKLLRPSKK